MVNVVHDHNGVVYLDGQAGTLADLPEDPATVHFLPTSGHIHLPASAELAGGDLPPAWVGVTHPAADVFDMVSAERIAFREYASRPLKDAVSLCGVSRRR